MRTKCMYSVAPIAMSLCRWRPMTALERSHRELRAALIVAGCGIRKLNFGRRDNPVLARLRAGLRKAQAVAKLEREKPRIRPTR
jgi:hypothetical protein